MFVDMSLVPGPTKDVDPGTCPTWQNHECAASSRTCSWIIIFYWSWKNIQVKQKYTISVFVFFLSIKQDKISLESKIIIQEYLFKENISQIAFIFLTQSSNFLNILRMFFIYL